MIIYIHGYGGSGDGTKAKFLREALSDEGFIAPSLSYVPTLAISTLKELVSSYIKNENVYLIGSSLGGYYAIYLADYFNIPAALINPSVNPTITLKRSLGNGLNFYDESTFEWNKNHLEMLRDYEVKDAKTKLYLLLTQKGDELLDYKQAVDKLAGCKSFIEEGGSHSFDNIGLHVDHIKDFFIKEKV